MKYSREISPNLAIAHSDVNEVDGLKKIKKINI